MRVLLLYPPMGSLAQPYLSLPSLTAFLRERGHMVVQFDVGIRALNELLSKDSIERFGALAEISYRRLAVSGRKEVPEWLEAAALLAPSVAGAIESAKNTFRDASLFYDVEGYRRACRILELALDVISAAHYPTRLARNGLTLGPPAIPSAGQAVSVSDPFADVLRRSVMPPVLAQEFDVIGLSATYGHQLAPAFRLAELVKELAPNTPIVLGGAAVTAAEGGLRVWPDAFAQVDAYVFGEGEAALCWLVEHLAGNDGSDPPNLFRQGSTACGRRTRSATSYERLRYSDLPSPDYAGLNLQDYLAPEIVPLLSNARGCYYRKCAFCNVSLAYMDYWDERPLGSVRRDIERVQADTGASCVYFSDDCISPRRCREVADLVVRGELKFSWAAEARLERAFDRPTLELMAAGGCRSIIFGNESAEQRVLDLMCKGTQISTATQVVRDAAELGIPVHLQNFLGFPGETFAEADSTVEYLINQRANVSSFALGLFHVAENSPIQRNPARFGLTSLRRRSKSDLIPAYRYRRVMGDARTWQRVHRRAVRRLQRAYPNQSVFLDGPIGSHMLLYMSRYGRFASGILAPPDWDRALLDGHPRIVPGCRVIPCGRGSLLVNPDFAVSYVSQADFESISNAAAGDRMRDLCLQLAKRSRARNGSGAVKRFVVRILDLYRAGILTLDPVEQPTKCPQRLTL